MSKKPRLTGIVFGNSRSEIADYFTRGGNRLIAARRTGRSISGRDEWRVVWEPGR